MDPIKAVFNSPPAKYRTVPLWVWNSAMTDEEIVRSLTELKNHGFGGAFVHPRPGMKISYLDDAWFKAWGKALETAKGLGLKLNIYDENSYPSGFGGGHVSRELPDCLSESFRYQVIPSEDMDFRQEQANWMGNEDLILALACEKENGRMVFREDVTGLPKEQWRGKGSFFAVVARMPSQTAGWLAGFADVDRLRPETAETFLEKVYSPYAQHFGEEFGDTVLAVFTDEPAIPGSTIYGWGNEGTIPMSRWFAWEFFQKKGYDIIPRIPCLFEDWEGYDNEKVRFDYYEVTQELWAQNFLEPIHDWCQKQGIRYTGHFMEDGWPKPFYSVVSPGVMSSFEYQDWPGVDFLLTRRLKDRTGELQGITLLEVQSAASQFGRERVLCEAYGAGGYDSGLTDYKRIADYLFVNGINLICPHLVYTSYVGARKRDHPQSFDSCQSWWEEFTVLNDWMGRLSAVLSQGRGKERILVIDPTMTGFLCPRNGDCSQLENNILSKEPDMRPFLEMIEELKRGQWDLNLGDEIIMKRHGRVREGRLEIGASGYQVVILHECMKNLLPSTLKLLEDFMEEGGLVLSAGKPGNYVAGSRDEKAYEKLFSRSDFLLFPDVSSLISCLENILPRPFILAEEMPEGVESIRRILEDGRELYFFVNHSSEDVKTVVSFAGSAAEEWNPWDGSIKNLGEVKEGRVCFPLELLRGESRLFCIGHTENTSPAEEEKKKSPCVRELNPDSICPDEENLWPLEYCDLFIDGEVLEDCSVIFAGSTIFKKRGFPASPWDNQVQFQRRTYGRNRFYGPESGFEAVYHFFVAEGFKPGSLKLAVEYGDRYQIRVNGSPIRQQVAEHFLDPLVCLYDIQELVHPGENRISVTAPRFDVEMELEAVILKGDFGVYNRNSRWVMDRTLPLKPGSILEQGYPFYRGAILYSASFQAEEGDEADLLVPDVQAGAVSVFVNGEFAGLANLNGVKPVPLNIRKGENRVTVRLCVSLKNLLGPHFDPEKPRGSAWPEMWKKGPKVGEPPAEAYDLIPYGFDAPFKLLLQRPAWPESPPVHCT